MFDNTEAWDNPWLPCPPTMWCAAFGDRLSVSLVNQRQPALFAANTGVPAGMILASSSTILCSYFVE